MEGWEYEIEASCDYHKREGAKMQEIVQYTFECEPYQVKGRKEREIASILRRVYIDKMD